MSFERYDYFYMRFTYTIRTFVTFLQTVSGKKMERLVRGAKDKSKTGPLTHSPHLQVNCPFHSHFTWSSDKLLPSLSDTVPVDKPKK